MSIVHKQPYLQNFFSNVSSTALQSINTALNSASHSTSFILRKDNLATTMANVNVLAVRFKDNEIFNDYVDAWILKSSNAYCLIVAVNDLAIEVYKIEGSSNSSLYLAKVVENISILEVRDAMSTASSIAAAKIVITLTGTSGTLTAAQFADVTDDTKNVILLLNGYYYYLSDKQSDTTYLTFINASHVTNEAISHKAIVINKDSTSASYKAWTYEEVPSSGGSGGTQLYKHSITAGNHTLHIYSKKSDQMVFDNLFSIFSNNAVVAVYVSSSAHGMQPVILETQTGWPPSAYQFIYPESYAVGQTIFNEVEITSSYTFTDVVTEL